jgi:hypothetical protein
MFSGAGFNFANIGILQPKLKISQPGDNYEQEADRVAEQVMRMRKSESSAVPAKEDTIDRKCTACEIEEEDEGVEVSRKPSDTSMGHPGDQITDAISNIPFSQNSPLDAETTRFMESRFGYDFRNDRIHTDHRASESAK